MIKLDFEKVFDHVNWDFLLKTLSDLGFGTKWFSWIEMCIATTKFYVLVNGSPKGFFGASDSLKQGNPLSPLLFILVTYVLNRMLRLATNNNLIHGIKFPRNGPEVLNIQYADDTLLFMEASESGLINLKRIICCFQTALGLKINFTKSSLTGIGISSALAERFSSILGCGIASLPINYLPFPLERPPLMIGL